jgi:hypothetical protein
MNLVNNIAWQEAMRRAQQARRLARGAETHTSKQHLLLMSRFFIYKAREVRERDRRVH